MKKIETRVVSATAEVMTGSYGGIDIGALYIDMLCERFKNRGIKSGLSEVKSEEIRRNAALCGLTVETVSADDAKYKSLVVDGKAYMSSDDFAAYYKDLRGYKLPHFYSRAEKEYEEAEAVAKNVQESGKPPKKALWLAVKRRVKDGVKDFFSVFVVEEFRKQSEEEVVEAYKNGSLNEAFGTGTAAVVSPIGLLDDGNIKMTINGGEIGPVAQKLYDTLTGIQWGKIEDSFGWTVKVV